MQRLSDQQIKTILQQADFLKPERRDQAGQILILGGLSFKLSTVNSFFKKIVALGSSATICVPKSLAKVFKRGLPELLELDFDSYFGITDQGTKTLQDHIYHAGSLILADTGSNSKTALSLAKIISDSTRQIIISPQSLNLLLAFAIPALNNPRVTIFTDLGGLQKIIKLTPHPLELLSSSNLNQRIEVLKGLREHYPAQIILITEGQVLAIEEELYLAQNLESNPEGLIASFTCWQIWNPTTGNFLNNLASAIYS
jgi:hypothetical protein